MVDALIMIMLFGFFNDNTCCACDSGYYDDKGTCQPCPSYCTFCSSKNQCISCTNETFCEQDSSLCSVNCSKCENRDIFCEICQKGYFLDQMQSCIRCPENCQTCANESYCLHCSNGYKGLACSEECSNCKPNTVCDKNHGYCSDGCKDGYTDLLCNRKCDQKCKSCYRQDNNTCLACADNRYGLTCDEECPKTCHGGKCNASNGFCIGYCEKGYWGITCEQSCSNFCNDKECYRQNGTCKYGCIDNYTGERCVCPIKCICDLDGSCKSCKHYGEMCEHSCSNGCLGEMCLQTTGECTEGCKNGFNGTHCDKVLSTDNTTNSDTIIPDTLSIKLFGLVIGLAVLVIVIFISARLWYTCKCARDNKCDLTMSTFVENQTGVIRLGIDNILEDLDDTATEGLIITTRDDTYYNTAALQRRKIQLNKLAEYVGNKPAEDFIIEFQDLPADLIKPFKESQRECNLTKNRYRGIYPYDSTRVVLKEGISDYINASFIDGYNHWRAYIASLGPTTKFMGDMSPFWNMVWQEKCEKIVMLTNLIEGEVSKCDQYWPNEYCTSSYGDINVRCELEQNFVDFVVRYFHIEKKSERREVAQFHFTAWPDKGVPKDIESLIVFRNRVNNYRSYYRAPTVVHCSAGVGRTGTFIALDILANEGKAERCVDIFACVRNLREQRVKMVQTVEQYEYLHHAVVHLFNVDQSLK